MKNTFRRTTFYSVLLAASTALAGFVICPHCGYENDEPRTQCRHCRGKLPESAKPQKDTDTADPAKTPSLVETVPSGGVEGATITAETVAEEITLGKNYIRAGDLDMARLYLKNAAALDMLRVPGSGKDLSSEITDLISHCEAVGQRVKRRCPECEGTGKQNLNIRRLNGEVDYMASGAKCDRCDGKGVFVDAGLASERKFRMGRALNTYTRLQQGRKYVPVGGAWVPMAVETLLTIRQTVQLKRVTALPCPECMGVGRTDCDECKGLGFEKCSNRDCENGKVEVEKGGQLSKSTTVKQLVRCPVCLGKSRMACAECLGRGSIVCEKCGGTGQRDICSRCGGQGMMPCRRCRGAGTYRGVKCETCTGSGSAPCSSCSGDGRKR